MQEYKTTTIQLRSFAKKTLTYHDEITLQTLVVNLPSREMPKMPRKSFLQGSGEREREREREAHIFKNLRERERFGSVFYIIHKKYIF
jgi:hypothetical protein